MIELPTEAEPVRVVHGDCLDILREMRDGCVDAVITDPPYNVGFEYGSTGDKRTDYADWCRSWFGELERVSRGPIVLTPGIVNVAAWCGIRPPQWILCWHKPATMGRSPIGFNNWEPVMMWGKPLRRDGCDVVYAPIKTDPDLNGHPCPKPLQWGIGFVKLLTHPGMTVLDPFAGSGTTGVACAMTGRRWLGIEIDATYTEMARRRIDEAMGVGGLFPPPTPTEPTLFAGV